MARSPLALSIDPVLTWGAIIHLVVAAIALAALLVDAAPILGVHPGLKPMKFALSIAVFLGSMAILVPCLSLGADTRRVIAWALAIAMALEMIAIAVQALRGTTSHFNRATPVDHALWNLMIAAIAVATLATFVVAAIAIARPLASLDGRPMPALVATAWRIGLAFFVLGALTGFRMGAQLAHSVGGPDGGPGLPLVNWSTQHGDLRAAHFVGLHALQSLPLTAAVLARAPVAGPARWASLAVVIAVHVLLAAWATWRALTGRPIG